MKAKKLLLCLALAAMIPMTTSCGEEKEEVVLTMNETEFAIKVGDKMTLKVEGYEGSQVTWTSSNTAVATVLNGVVTGVSDGECVITAAVDGATVKCNATIVDLNNMERYVVSSVLDNPNIQEFNTNTKEGQTKFRGKTSLMEVGDDNPFVMEPKLTIINNDLLESLDQKIWPYLYTSKIQEWDEAAGKYKDAARSYAEFDSAKCTFDFNEFAIGKRLKLSVTPGGLKANQVGDRYTRTAEVIVKEGYNVYNAADLALFNDTESDHRGGIRHSPSSDDVNAGWKEFRKNHGLDETYLPENLFLQTNIKITKNDVPSVFFYKSGDGEEVGSLKDGSEIYLREKFDSFTFNANYFNLDTTEFPLATEDLDKDGISHSTLFKVTENRSEKEYTEDLNELKKTKPEETGAEFTTCEFKNCSYFGNSPLANDLKYAGGLIFFKNENLKDEKKDDDTETHKLVATFDNFNVQRSCIAFYGEGNPDLTIKDCTVKQGYSNSVYLYLGTDMKIVNCEFTECGGPIIVLDSKLQNDGKFAPKVLVDDNSIMDNMVTGQEPWFVSTGANTAIGGILKLDAFMNALGSTFIDINEKKSEKKFNSILVKRSGSGSVESSIQFGNSHPLGFTAEIETSEELAELKAKRDYALVNHGELFMFQTDNGGTAWTNAAAVGEGHEEDIIFTGIFADGQTGTQNPSVAGLVGGRYLALSANMGTGFGQIMLVTSLKPLAA